MRIFLVLKQIKVNWHEFLIDKVGRLTGTKVMDRKEQMIHFYSLTGMIIIIGLMIYLSGGISPITHLLYIPIIFSAFLLSPKKAVLIAFLSGFDLSANQLRKRQGAT